MISLGIREQLVGLAVVCAIPGALGLGLYAYSDWSTAIDMAQSRSYAVAKRVAASLDGGFNEYDYLLGQLASRPQTRSLDKAHCDPLLIALPSLRPELTALTVRELDSSLVCSSLTQATARLGAEDAALAAKGAGSGGLKVVGVTRGEVSGRLVARMTYPVRNAAGAIAAELLAPLDLRSYGQRVMSDLPDNIRVAVIDPAGTILMRSRAAEPWEGRPMPEGLWKRDDRREARIRDGDRIGAFVTVPVTGWVVSASLSEEGVLAAHRATALVATSAALACFALALFGAWLIGRSIARPVEGLVDIGVRFSNGGTSARAVESGPRELRRLVRSFNALLDQLEPRA